MIVNIITIRSSRYHIDTIIYGHNNHCFNTIKMLSKVGKWHLGHCNKAFLPNNRGFQSFFGQYTHKTHYYTR